MVASGESQPNGSGKWKELEVDKLFRAVVKVQGTDLHLKVGMPPHVRAGGTLRPLNRELVDQEEMTRMLLEIMDCEPSRREIFDRDGSVDFAYELEVDGIVWLFRVIILQQMGSMSLVARRVNIF